MDKSKWDRWDVTGMVRDILMSAPADDKYGTGRPFMTTYQIAAELFARYPDAAQGIGLPPGGRGDGPYALTTFLARWLPDRIAKRGATDIEMAFLSPCRLESIEVARLGGGVMVATTNTADFNSTMFRYAHPLPAACENSTP